MAFTKDIVEKAWNLSKGHCQCERSFHDHEGRCPQNLVWEDRGIHEKLDGRLIVRPTRIADSATARFSVSSVSIQSGKYF